VNQTTVNKDTRTTPSIVTKTVLLDGKDAEAKRQEILTYFQQTFDLYDSLFECLAGEAVFFQKAIPLRHPLIFYYGHTAVFYVNKLLVSKCISQRVNPDLESMVAIGVDEMSWDDLDEKHYAWPSVDQVRTYRQQIRALVSEFIQTCEVALPIRWDDPLWIVMMGIEHERIHLETSSVLIRQLPLDCVQPHATWPVCPNAGVAPDNRLLPVAAAQLHRHKQRDDVIWGWDNEYGEHAIETEAFQASQYLVSNQEFLAFVQDGGYLKEAYWTTEGWAWVNFAQVVQPEFWVSVGEDYRYRTMLSVIDMPWDWPVDVNYLEAKAFCQWKSAQTGHLIRLPSEDEWFVLRAKLNTDQPYWDKAPGNLNLEYWASACPVTQFEQAEGFYDIIGNVWQWTETAIDAFSGFKVHDCYDDFSTPTFDGQHNLIKGGCYFSTGNYATKDSRYAFRRHFFQHAGFRYIESERDAMSTPNIYETDQLVSQYIEFHYGDKYFDVPNFAQTCAQLCLDLMQQRNTERALDLGCAVGRSTFELARGFEHVDGLDFSARFIAVAAHLQAQQTQRYVLPDEGELVAYKATQLSTLGLADNAERCRFMQSDACNLHEKYRDYDLVFAGNLIDRLYAPAEFLSDIHTRIRPGGLLVLTSPYTWLADFTPRQDWLGGFKVNGENYTTLDALHALLGPHFNAVGQPQDVPFVIRETQRKFQHTVAQFSVWERQ